MPEPRPSEEAQTTPQVGVPAAHGSTPDAAALATGLMLQPNGPFPQEFGRYTLMRLLGEGGMGAVYLARDRRLDADVALKVPHQHLLHDPTHLQRFYREARAAAQLAHPNFCRVFDVDCYAGHHFLTMPYIAGTSLARHPRQEPRQEADLIRRIALALADAHAIPIVHRDLKPSNILVTPRGEPVITDFGLALREDGGDDRLTQAGACLGTPAYMAPEQFLGDPQAIGPGCDIYSLGVILYERLTDRLPFEEPDMRLLRQRVLHDPVVAPSARAPGLDPRLEAICLRALAKRSDDRFRDMLEFAAALAEFLGVLGSPGPSSPVTAPVARTPGSRSQSARPLLRREVIRFAFAGFGERAPQFVLPQDRLYLDVGNDLRPGVIDHHHLSTAASSTASLMLAHPEFLDGAVIPSRRPEDPFFLVLHEKPDLDGLASAYLAITWLTTGSFPAGAEVLARYVDKVDEGSLGMSLANPCSLYAAYAHIGNRLMHRRWNSDHERWQDCVRQGLQVVAWTLERMTAEGTPLPAVDAFACPGLFTDEDRNAVRGDVERYQRKLAHPVSRARRALVRLPGQFGGMQQVEALLVRDVQNADDPERCIFFKDWARTDAVHCPNGRGFVALSVFMSEGPRQQRRCFLSVTPDSGVMLRGLGALLDQAEGDRRKLVYGVDDRVLDPVSGALKVPRPGYGNADPWYDGRAHEYTIVDAPRSGTLLTADEIEKVFLQYGGCTIAPEPLART